VKKHKENENKDGFGIELEVNGIPKAMPRQRFRMIRMKSGKQFIHSYTPTDKIQTWYDLFIQEARKKTPNKTMDGAIEIDCEIRLPRPKGHYKKNGELNNEEKYHTKKPDFDNLMKLMCDILTNLGYYKDDSQIAKVEVVKYWANHLTECGVKMKIREII